MQRLLASGSPSAPTYVDDVFSAYTRSGTGASATVTTGIDLSTKGGLVITKARSAATGWRFTDTLRGVTKSLDSSATTAQATDANGITAFGTTGHTVGSDTNYNNSTGPVTYVDYVVRKAAKFFDVVTYTGTGSAQTISHSLGQAPGMIIVKQYSTGLNNWMVYHRAPGATQYAYLDSTNAFGAASTIWNDTAPTASVFTVGTNAGVNSSGASYVAYLFAHDTATDGLIQCGSFTTDGSGNATVSLGWEPQYVLVKTSSAVNDWQILDSSRAFTVNAVNELLLPNSSAAATTGGPYFTPNATGFLAVSRAVSTTYIYMAIRRPNKPPTTGTQVYNAIARTGTGAAATVTGVGFAPDLLSVFPRDAFGGAGDLFFDRLRGSSARLGTSNTSAEATNVASNLFRSFDMDGVTFGDDTFGLTNYSTKTYINYFFKRAPGVFDEVCYTSTTEAAAVTHGLTVAPELVLIKSRSAGSWYAIHYGIDGYNPLTNVAFSTGLAPTYTPTSSNFKDINASASQLRVAYLFATKAGISKVGSYTGNGGTAGSAGTSQTIDCGFTAGARFVMLKCTSNTSDWVVVDTVRGLIAANDPALSLNTTAAEVTTTDLLDPDNSGFVVNQLATGTTSADFNVTGRTYIYLAFA